MAHSTTELLARYRESGLAQKKFCAAFKVPFSTLQYHLQKSKAKTMRSVVSGFLSFPASVQASTTSTIVMIRGPFTPAQIVEIINFGAQR